MASGIGDRINGGARRNAAARRRRNGGRRGGGGGREVSWENRVSHCEWRICGGGRRGGGEYQNRRSVRVAVVGLRTGRNDDSGAIVDIPNSFQCTFDVKSFDVGPDKGATLPCITNMLQETGVEQLVSLHGRGGKFYATDPEMDKLNLIYVLSRMRIDMYKYPSWGDRVRVRTWFAMSGKTAWRRDWLIHDASTHEFLGAASSIWLTVNTETRRLGRITPELREKYVQLTNDASWAICEGVTASKVPEMKTDSQTDAQKRSTYALEVPYGALDMNGHVNNVEYMSWLLDAVPSGIREGFSCRSITLEYRREGEVGSNVICDTCVYEDEDDINDIDCIDTENAMRFLHVLRESETSRELVRGKSHWIRNPIAQSHELS